MYPPTTPERKTLDSALTQGLALIWQHQLAQRILIDGSYITSKLAPGDVDLAVLTPGIYQSEGEQLFAMRGVDTIMLHIQFAHDTKDFDQWIDFFSHSPLGMLKGVIEIEEDI